jgi:hypothetical protein
MSRRSRSARREAIEQNPFDAGSGPSQKHRRLLWAAVLIVATAGVTVGAVHLAESFHRADPRAAEVEELIRRYFRTWSSQDIQGYGECFLENASIQFIDPDGKIENYALPAFLADQGEFLRAGRNASEVPVSIEIRFESELARVVVNWKLSTGVSEVLGYDHFTLLKRNGKWGIVNLAFYNTKVSGQPPPE